MNTKSITKKALISSIIAMALCCTMFIGTTFAWFTDSVTSTNNVIKSGTLTVDLQMWNGTAYESIVDEKGAIFAKDGNGINWEPGKTEIVYLKVQNNGTLNLKFDFLLSVIDGGLIGSLDYAIVDGVTNATTYNSWEEVKTAATTEKVKQLAEGVTSVLERQKLAPKNDENDLDTRYFALAVHMNEGVDNKYQGKSVTIDASVFATQVDAESDSFGSDYDANVSVIYDGTKDFMTLWNEAQEGTTIYLAKEVKVDNLSVSKNVIIQAAGQKVDLANGITFAEGKSLTIMSAKMEKLSVSGAGELVLYGTSIVVPDTVENAGVSALTVNGNDVKVVVKGYTALMGATNGHGIYADTGSTLNLSGTGKLVATGNAGQEDKATRNGGSGIGGAGTIYIHDMANLTAEGYGVNGFGIGANGAAVTVENTNIAYAKGGFVQQAFVSDLKYGKSEPEGGAAIGGATITLDKVTVEKAEGGSKAAGIGARYHEAVTIHISNSTIKEVIGGNASAGIGGSRIRQDNQKGQTITIHIADSTINAIGGQFAAGIGSGYDTHCSKQEYTESPICSIYITGESKITAKGGARAAGIGTGYHAGGLAGEIAPRVGESGPIIDAKAGISDKADYSVAQDVGFGVVDPAREGQTSVNCQFNNQGTIVTYVSP